VCEGAVWWLRVKRLAVGQGRLGIPCNRRARVCVEDACVCVCVCGVGWEAVGEWEEERLGDIWREMWRKKVHIKLPSKNDRAQLAIIESHDCGW
jgi:hypothetical protein